MRQEVKIIILNSECYFVHVHLDAGRPNFILRDLLETKYICKTGIVVFVILYLYGLKVLSVKKTPMS